MDLKVLKQYLPALSSIKSISRITKGFSSDEKFFLYGDSPEPLYVLRTAGIAHAERKQTEFQIIGRMNELKLQTSKAIEFGCLEPLNLCYMLLSYVPGEDAADVLPKLSREEQYRIGVKAGEELQLMNRLEAPPMMGSWFDRRLAKHRRHYDDYRQCGVTVSEERSIVRFVEENLKYMKGRPNRFQHDDFHPSNLIVQAGRYAGVIDFNRYDWGDPFHEFLKIAYFSREVSIPFCIGQIEGYFQRNIPSEFWSLYALYTAMNIFGTITWTLQVVPEQLDSMLARIDVIAQDHQGYERTVPIWFQPDEFVR